MVELSSDATKLTVIEGKVSTESVAIARYADGVGRPEPRERRDRAGCNHDCRQAAGRRAVGAEVSADQRSGSKVSSAEKLLRAGSVDEALAEVDRVLRRTRRQRCPRTSLDDSGCQERQGGSA